MRALIRVLEQSPDFTNDVKHVDHFGILRADGIKPVMRLAEEGCQLKVALVRLDLLVTLKSSK